MKSPSNSPERGYRGLPEDRAARIMRQMAPDAGRRATIREIRHMDLRDGRVKRIHTRTAAAAVKGGLRLGGEPSARVRRLWEDFHRTLRLRAREKLESDLRGLLMEGAAPIQWVIDGGRVVDAVRLPAETIRADVDETGAFRDPRAAYEQWDWGLGRPVVRFPLWKMSVARLDPLNRDDLGDLGRPYLDASRRAWRQLTMTEDDLVIRRRTRASQRIAHHIENMSEENFQAYYQEIERAKANGGVEDYYLRGKGTVTALAGDANMDQIGDVVHLLDTFFAGAPGHRALFGYTEGMTRDILEDLTRLYYDEIDRLQDTAAWVYEQGFELQMLLSGVDPAQERVSVEFAQRRTETPNQAADRALKYQALGASPDSVLETAGLEPSVERTRWADAEEQDGPYPAPMRSSNARPQGESAPRVTVTPGNGRKGESATDVGGG